MASIAAPRTVAEIQGSTAESPLVGETVVVIGIVSRDYLSAELQPDNDPGGFFLQQESPDDFPATSDGVFVSNAAGFDIAVRTGDRVEVTGRVVESAGETRLIASRVVSIGRGLALPVELLLPENNLERFEGMLVYMPQMLTVADLYNLQRYGEVLLVEGGRRMQFTNGSLASVDGYAEARRQKAARGLILDDGSEQQNRQPVRYLFPEAPHFRGRPLRVGDQLRGLTGHLRFSRSDGKTGTAAYRLIPVAAPVFIAANDRPAGTPAPGGSLKVASFNLLNFFATLDDGRKACGPERNSNCRGANTAEEFERQLARIGSAMSMLDADIVGLIELENTDDAALHAIVSAANSADGRDRWTALDTGPIGTDAIRNGFIFKSSSVATHGAFSVLNNEEDSGFDDSKNRPVLAQTFRAVSTGGVLTVAIAHLKSKGSSCDDRGDPDLADGQGNCNQTRVLAVSAITRWLAGDPTRSGDPDILVIGDMNSYLREDPVLAFERAGYVNLLREAAGYDAYSYVFRGNSGALDHAFASPSLLPQIRGVVEWHINADEAPVLDYNLDFGRDPALFEPASPYRSSDHDPIVVGLEPARN